MYASASNGQSEFCFSCVRLRLARDCLQLLPFGRKAVSRAESGRYDLGTGPFGLIGNLIWLVLAGWWLALGHVLTAIVLAVTIVGIPFAWAHLKLDGIALWPIGKEIVAADAVPFGRSTAER